jgi:hypothetical protein
MINPDILGGLRSALTRGYSLDEAMISFLNAGYKREEIEEASQSLQSQIAPAQSLPQELAPQPVWTLEQDHQEEKVKKPEIIQPELIFQQSSQPKQKQIVVKEAPKEKPRPAPPKQVVTRGVAAYTEYDTSRIRTITIILAILLFILVGILGLMYVFKSQIIDFFNSLF